MSHHCAGMCVGVTLLCVNHNDIFNRPIPDVLEYIKYTNDLLVQQNTEFSNIRLDVDYVDGIEYSFVGDRPLTKDEIADDESRLDKNRTYRRKQYEALKKEFECQ